MILKRKKKYSDTEQRPIFVFMSCCVLSQKFFVLQPLTSSALKKSDRRYKLCKLICMVHTASGLDGYEALWWSATGALLRGRGMDNPMGGSIEGLLNIHA